MNMAITSLCAMGALLLSATVNGAVLAEKNQEPRAPVDIKEWKVPYEGRSRDPYVANEDDIWFVGQTDGFLARFTPSTQKFFKRDLGEGAGPHNTIVGEDSIVWIAGNLNTYIGRYDPKTDKLEKNPDAGTSCARSPHARI